tara:strand:+ start:415 stop:1629 length:1215 start_codon:yes stop_codon:yes gene_type:complete
MGYKSDLKELIDDLPKLMQQYSIAMAQLEHNKQIREDEREYQANLSLYQDAKTESIRNERLYNETRQKYLETGLSLEKLNDMFKTNKSLKVLDDISTVKADDYAARADYYSDQAMNFATKTDIMSGVLVDDVRKAKNIMAGGAGPTGGSDLTGWDVQDINIDAFKAFYGEDAVTPQVEEYFQANPGSIQTALSTLQSTDYKQKISEQKYNYYKGKTEGSGPDKSRDWYKQRISSAKTTSGKSMVDAYNFAANDEKYDDLPANQNEPLMQSATLKADIMQDLSVLYGVPISDSLYDEYDMMFKLAAGSKMEGKYTPGDFTAYHEGVQKAYEHYSKADNKDEIQQVAQRIFGFNGLFKNFAEAENVLYTQSLLYDFRNEGILDEGQVDDTIQEDEFDRIIGNLGAE